jgi:hypothetical protein
MVLPVDTLSARPKFFESKEQESWLHRQLAKASMRRAVRGTGWTKSRDWSESTQARHSMN